MAESNLGSGQAWPDYRAVWRWHFYASLFCMPFVIVLSLTGAIYLFKPQLDRWMDSKFDRLAQVGTAKPASEQVNAAVASLPGAEALSYELPPDETCSARIVVKKDKKRLVVFVDPRSLEVRGMRPENQTLTHWIKVAHGQLFLGIRGSNLVELAASWTFIMIFTGLYLWWPRSQKGLGGIIYPRLFRSTKIFWRDVHSVTGVWISIFALFLLATGLPWAKFWGEYFRTARSVIEVAQSQDWTVGGEAVANKASSTGEHSDHGADAPKSQKKERGAWRASNAMPSDLAGLDKAVAATSGLMLANPIIISGPADQSSLWTVKSESQNRTLRMTVNVDGRTGEIVSKESFWDRPLTDQIVGIGIAAHEGQLFGVANQVLGLLTALGLTLLSVSGFVIWWRRREPGQLGIPKPLASPRWAWSFIAIVVLLAIYLPLFGATLLIALALDRWVFRRFNRHESGKLATA